jgi:hypothetical protein
MGELPPGTAPNNKPANKERMVARRMVPPQNERQSRIVHAFPERRWSLRGAQRLSWPWARYVISRLGTSSGNGAPRGATGA